MAADKDLYPYGVPHDDLVDSHEPLSIRELLSPRTMATMLRDLIARWFTTRPLSLVLTAIPALLAIAVIATALLWWAASDNIRTLARYQNALNEAVREERWEEAKLLTNALLRFEPENLQYQFNRGLILQSQGRDEAAAAIFRSLAPVDAIGYTPARFQVVRRAVADNDLKTAILQMQRAQIEDPENDSVTRTLGQLYLQAGEFPEAERLLLAAAKQTPELLPTLARLQEEVGNELGSQQTWQRAAAFFGQRWEKAGDEQDLRQAIAAYVAREEFSTAETFLLKAHRQRQSEATTTLLADLYTLWARDFRDKKQFRQQWKLLVRALQHSPRHLPTLVDITEISVGDSEQAKEAREMIHGLLAEGEVPGAIHMLVGAHAAQDGDLERAEYHLDQAIQHDGRTPAILNNMAWVLATRDEPKLEEAKRMVDEALALPASKSDRANMFDTRGMILFKQDEYAAALTDFEKALNLVPDTEIFMQHLVDAYRALDDDTSADAVISRMRRLGFTVADPKEKEDATEGSNP